ncbi:MULTISPECIES: SDR family NAD(P)-dependent oxidoreductase [Rhizobium]|uniref:SDR family NAD(P)-dependent oxidoreductase n=1 Tax=Rhizobium TaxID=379 RepID=UPI0007EB68F7|nr:MULTISPECIES: SDR family NAD(P)-dependent oxidoreductase [Rhizobium]ANK94434.1 short-chain dehydrogenase/reductase SDR family protein [Rhizobium sp. N6212]ANL00484.1 short-chain dehydrogenase/reductase SDR family protein [Rhizobium sp. N621]ANL06605.1 short-chain dehydrogenase/reductase SDR family protein [Rhizobium esperanzae]ANL12776.1 short-chain dehydrogenase/reductase SDR family protein [Rhizobium sp. N1341]ANL24762.1 short-chain dehydrogenase/reductase SDR family protein [Rhizobium sp
MHHQPVALVTGANKGIGLQIAKDLAQQGFTVLLGSRRFEAGENVVRGVGPDARTIQLDVTDGASIAQAAARIRETYGRLDVLVNNAGVGHGGAAGRSNAQIVTETRMSVVKLDELRTVFATNVFGVLAVTQAMLPLLRAAPAAKIINISSSTGSLTLNSNFSNPLRQYASAYTTSKSALNAITQALAIELEGTHIKVHAVCPGLTATDMSEYGGPVEDAAREPVRVALLGSDSPTGTFSNAEGTLPW